MSANPSEPSGEIIEQLKQQLDLTERQLGTTKQRLQYAELKIQVLEERLRLKRIQMYGPGSEKLTNEQLELLELEPGVSTAEVQAESAREPVPVRPTEKRVRQHPGRQALPAELPRVERVIGCTAEQCLCGGCGRETTVIGYEESEQLDVEPAKYFVVVTKREKRACKSCEERGVLAAPLPPRIIEKSLVSDRVVIDVLVRKYADHCPLYRQSAVLERDSGLELSRQTLDGWVMRVGELLVPLAEALRRELLRGSYLQADETPVGVQMHDGNGSNHLAYLWQYGRPHGAVVFNFRMGRGREGPKRFLEKFDGLLQSDGYAVYDSVGGPKMVHACCWSHARRKFVEAVKLHPQDAQAVRIVRLIDELFAELSNNLAENSMRPVALGRKNWIHIGSQQAGPKVAAILSVVETCRRMNIPVRQYLAAVLPGLAETPIHRLPQLTPIAWASQSR